MDNHKLLEKNFLITIAAQIINSFGDAFSLVALPLLVFHASGKALDVSALLILETICILIFTPLFGPMVDRHDRRHLLAFSLAGQGTFMTLIAVFKSSLGLMPIYASVIGINALYSISRPTLLAYFHDLIDDKSLFQRTSSISETASYIAKALGAAFAGAIMQLTNPTFAFMIDAATFFLMAILIYGFTSPVTYTKAAKTTPRYKDQLAEMLAIVHKASTLRSALVIALINGLSQGTLYSSYIFHMKSNLGFNDFLIGITCMIESVALSVGCAIAFKKAKNIRLAISLCFGAMSAGFIILAKVHLIVPSITAIAVICLTFGYIIVATRTLCQKTSTNENKGRVMALRVSFAHMGALVGSTAAGLCFDLTSTTWIYSAAGIIALLSILLTIKEHHYAPATD